MTDFTLNEERLYSMGVGECILGTDYEALRVPGGWVFSRVTDTDNEEYAGGSCFVPIPEKPIVVMGGGRCQLTQST
jgi:hypothetical protein